MLQVGDISEALGWTRQPRTDDPRDPEGRGLLSDMIGAVSRALSDDVEAQLRARQVDAVVRLGTALMLVHLVNAASLVFVLWATGQLTAPALAWSGLLAVPALYGLVRSLRARGKPAPRTASVRTVNRVVRSALLYGLIWAVPGLTFMPGLSGFAGVFAYLLLTGMIAGGGFGLYPIPAAATAFMIPITLSGVAGLATVYGAVAIGPAVVAAMFLFVFRQVIRRHSDLFTSEFVGRVELEKRNRLIEDLLEDARVGALGTRQMIEERLARAQKMEAIGQLTGGLAHHFNNLLSVIQGNAELLERDGRSDPALIEPILSGCRQGAEQIQRLLSIAGKQRLDPEPVAVGPLLEDVIRLSEPILGTRIRIRTRDCATAPAVFADRMQLENALLSLVLNAQEAMPDGGEIVLSCRRLAPGKVRARIGRKPAPALVEIAVRDTGKGMDAATLDRATDPFFTTKAVGRGAGLGLSGVDGFARQSGGAIEIESAPGRGTTVRLRLPAARLETTRGTEDGMAAETGAAPMALVVDDIAEVRTLTAKMLESLGYRVIAVGDPEEAIRRASGLDEIDVVLTDILLSGSQTGLQLARALREIRPGLAIAFMSGWANDEIDPDSAADGGVLVKPFTRRQLEAHLNRVRARSAEPLADIPFEP